MTSTKERARYVTWEEAPEEPRWDWRSQCVNEPHVVEPSLWPSDTAETDTAPLGLVFNDDSGHDGLPDFSLSDGLAHHVFEPTVVAPSTNVDTQAVPAEVRESRLLREALDALRDHGKRARRFVDAALDGVSNARLRIATLRRLTDSGRTLDELELALQLKEAWREELDCGECYVRSHEHRHVERRVDMPLSWDDAIRVLDTFSSLPTIDELRNILAAVHDEWLEAWYEYHSTGWAQRTSSPHPTFARYLLERLRAREQPFNLTRWGTR